MFAENHTCLHGKSGLQKNCRTRRGDVPCNNPGQNMRHFGLPQCYLTMHYGGGTLGTSQQVCRFDSFDPSQASRCVGLIHLIHHRPAGTTIGLLQHVCPMCLRHGTWGHFEVSFAMLCVRQFATCPLGQDQVPVFSCPHLPTTLPCVSVTSQHTSYCTLITC